MFSLTGAAAQQIQKAARESGASGMVLRVAARQRVDGSVDYGMGFDDAGDDDTRLLIEDVPVAIAPHHLELLDDTVLDFVELEPGQFNFVFVGQEPASSSDGGGCGNSGCGSGGCGSGGCGSHGAAH